MGDEPAVPFPEEGNGESQSRSFSSMNQYGYGWGQGGGGSGRGMMPAPYVPGSGFGYPPVPSAPPPYEGADTVIGGGGGPVIGFNPGMLHNTAQSYTECPICMEVLMKPIYQCSNGHVICSVCIERLDFCGQCRVPLAGPKIRNVALEQICESMEVKCPNQGEGCGAMTTMEHLRSHLDVCGFRALPLCSKFLGLLDCPAKVTTASVAAHLHEMHQAEIIDVAKFQLKLTAPSSTFEATSGQGAIWGPVVVTSALDTDIVLNCLRSPRGHLSFTGYLQGCSEDNYKDYRVKFQIDSKRSRVEWTGNLISVRHHSTSDLLPNVNTFQVPLLSLKEFIKPYHDDDEDPDQVKLSVKVALWKLSEEDNKPYKECFMDLETGDKEPINKLILHSKSHFASGDNSFSTSAAYPSSEAPPGGSYGYGYDHTTTSSHYPSENICTHCRRALYGVSYQCLQCPEATYFCRHCTEVGNVHSQHLTLRLSNAEQQPLAAVVYECASGDIN